MNDVISWIVALSLFRAVLHFLMPPDRNASNSFLIWASNIMIAMLIFSAMSIYFDWPTFGSSEDGDWRSGY